VFHVSIWALGALFGGAKPTKAPAWRRDWFQPRQQKGSLRHGIAKYVNIIIRVYNIKR